MGKRTRRTLATDYTRRYMSEILNHADLAPVVSALPATGLAALLCVERDPEACHRSLITGRLADQFGVTVDIYAPDDGRAGRQTAPDRSPPLPRQVSAPWPRPSGR